MNHPLYHIIQAHLEKNILETKKVIGNKLSPTDFWSLSFEVVKSLIGVAEKIPVPNFVKKTMVLFAAEQFYDLVLAPIDIPWVPNIVVEPLMDKMIKIVYLQAISAMIDYTVSLKGE